MFSSQFFQTLSSKIALTHSDTNQEILNLLRGADGGQSKCLGDSVIESDLW